ncbi:MAG: hypothetical protein KAW45_02015 [Thermoplasmatales archaeon]|nr:hypothetical protein [Thermoplasmatales archaeon]
MEKKRILKLKIRMKIYQFILKYPGLHIRKLSRDLNIPFSTLNHHLNYLKKQDLLLAKSDGRYIRYYVSKKVGRNDKKLLNLMRHKVPQTIILLLYLYPYGDFSQIEIARYGKTWKKHWTKIGFHLNKHPTTIAFHLDKLLEMGIIESYPRGNEIRYRLKNPDVIDVFLITYGKNFSDPGVEYVLRWVSQWADTNYKADRVDKFMEAFYEILPHPYHV